MSAWNNLPFEILFNVFKELVYLSDVSECQRTCKGWSLAAQERIYKEVQLEDTSKVIPFINSIALSHNKGGILIKSINFFLPASFKLEPHMIDNIALFCLNLETLDSHWSSDVWKEMLRHHKKGHFNRLKQMNLMITTPNYSDYVAAMLAYKNTMTNLSLMNDLSGLETWDSKQCDLLSQSLRTFPNLKDLNVRIFTKDNLFALEPLLDECGASLNTIRFTAFEPKGEDRLLTPALNKNMDLVCPRPNIKKIHAEGIYLTENIINYLMHKFPQLKELNLNDHGEGFHQRSSVFELSKTSDNSIMNKFFKYMSNIPSFKVCGRVEDSDLPNMMTMYKNIFANNDNLTVRFHYLDFGKPRMELEKTSIRYFVPKRIKIANPKDTAAHNILNLNYRQLQNLNQPSHVKFIKQYGDSIKEITLSTRIENDLEDSVMIDNFKYLFENCPVLEALTIKGMDFANEERDGFGAEFILPSYVKNESLQILVFERCAWYTKSELCRRLAHSFPSLKYLEFNDCQWVTTGNSPWVTEDNEEEGQYKIDIPGISLENITIVVEYERRKRGYEFAFLQINEDHYYMIGHNGYCLPVSKKNFEIMPKTMNTETYRINCKSIKTFTLDLYGGDNITFVNPIV